MFFSFDIDPEQLKKKQLMLQILLPSKRDPVGPQVRVDGALPQGPQQVPGQLLRLQLHLRGGDPHLLRPRPRAALPEPETGAGEEVLLDDGTACLCLHTRPAD